MSEVREDPKTPAQIAADLQNQKTADMIEFGSARFEKIKVFATDGKEHVIEVYAPNARQMFEARQKSGITALQLEDVGIQARELQAKAESEGKALMDMRIDTSQFPAFEAFILALAEVVTTKPAHISDLLSPSEHWKVGGKAMELANPPKALSTSSA